MKELFSKTIMIRVPPGLGDRLEAQAKRENNSVSAVTRRLLTQAMDRDDEERSAAATKRVKRPS